MVMNPALLTGTTMFPVPYLLDKDRRMTVLDALREVCSYRGWNLWAAHVRTNHVHVIVEAEVRPENVMNALKSYASRSLDRLATDGPDRKRGRAMEVRDGYGKTGTSRKLSATSYRGKANRWKFTWRLAVAYRSLTVAAQ